MDMERTFLGEEGREELLVPTVTDSRGQYDRVNNDTIKPNKIQPWKPQNVSIRPEIHFTENKSKWKKWHIYSQC